MSPRTMKARSRTIAIGAVALMAAASLAACGQGKTAGTGDGKTIKLAWYVNEQNVHYQGGALEFKKYIEEESDGELSVDLYPAEQLGKVSDSLTMLESGIADMAFAPAAYFPEQLPMQAAWDLPLGLKPDQTVEARWLAAHQDGPMAQELKKAELVPVLMTTVADYELSSTDRPLPDMASAKGLRVRVGTDLAIEQMKMIGANGIKGSSAEQFEQIDRGVTNANLFHYASFGATGIDALLNHGTTNLDMPSTGLYAFMSQSFWDGLSKEQQEIVYEAGRLGSIGATDKTIEQAADELERLKGDGFKTYEWPQADVDKMNKMFDEIPEIWIKAVKGGASDAVDQARKVAPDTTADEKTDLPADFENWKF